MDDANARPSVPSQAGRLRCRYSPREKLCFRTRLENTPGQLNNRLRHITSGFPTIPATQYKPNHLTHITKSPIISHENNPARQNHFPSIRHPRELSNAPNPPDQGSIYRCQPCHARCIYSYMPMPRARCVAPTHRSMQNIKMKKAPTIQKYPKPGLHASNPGWSTHHTSYPHVISCHPTAGRHAGADITPTKKGQTQKHKNTNKHAARTLAR